MLTRDAITIASRIMLPAYVALSLAYGLVYVADPAHRLDGVSALTFQRSLMPMWCWGCVHLALAALMGVALYLRSRMVFAFALACCAMTWLLWGAMYAVSVLQTSDTSVLAPLPSLFVTTACIASMTSLLRGEAS